MSRPKGSKNKKKSNNAVFIPYHASLKIIGKEFESNGLTVQEAIQNLTPDFAKAKSILTITKGDAQREKVLGIGLTLRLFGEVNKLTKEIALKQASALFDGF